MQLCRSLFEPLENRRLLSFTYWSSIGPAIALVPQSAGQLSSVSVVNFGTTVYTGPLNVTNTLNRIRADDGPDRSDDGIVYTNPQASGLPVDGTYYEFTVEPAAGTNMDFTTIASPGPMRILLATGGDCYFTGDHYSTFTAVYIPGSTSGSPVIGSFAANPTSVAIGTATTLTASNVTDTGGTITGVNFYLESNSTTGLQIGSDTLVGAGTQSGTSWSISAATTGLTAGTYTYYAVANDSTSASSAASSTTLTVTTPTGVPVIGSFAVSPTSVTIGTSAVLTAGAVTENGGTISKVQFYRESNGTSGLQTATDTLLGTGAQSGTIWTLNASTTGFTAGSYTYYAVATDTANVTSSVASTILTVTGGTTTSGTLIAWDVNGQSNFGSQSLAASQVSSGVIASLGLTRGSGVTTNESASSNAWGGSNWSNTSSGGISESSFVTFGLTVGSGEVESLSSINLNSKHSGTGPANGYWQYQVNGGAWNLIGDFASEFANTGAITPISLTGFSPLQNLAAGTAVVFRVVPYGATSTGGTWYIEDATGNDLAIGGTVSPVITTSPLQLAGPADYLKLDSDGLHVDIWTNTTGNGTASQSLLLSQISTMSYTGSATDDSLTLDFSNGDPLVSSGISFDGGSAGQNSLNILGTIGNNNFTVGSSTVTFGSIQIPYTHTTTININGQAGADVLTQSAQPNASLVFSSTTLSDSLNISAGTFAFPSATNDGSTFLLNNLSIGSTAKVAVPVADATATQSVLVLNSLTIAGSTGNWTGQLDLNNNDMIVQNGDLPTIKNQLFTGIESSTAISDPLLLHTIGVALNDDGAGSPLYSSASSLGTFDGQSPSTSSVLLRYTFFGDANLDGTVDGSDYSRIDFGVLGSSTGWFNGDFNYDGVVNGSDYTLIDNAFNRQSAAPAAVVASAVSIRSTAVPLFTTTDDVDELLKKSRPHTHLL